MAQRPIVKTRSGQFIQSDGGVVGMSALTADIRVKDGYRIRRTFFRPHARRQILGDPLAGVTDSRHPRDFFSTTDDGLGFRLAAEGRDIWGKLKLAAPTIQGIVVAMDEVDGNVPLRQS